MRTKYAHATKRQYMFEGLRLLKAAQWEGGAVDRVVGTAHAVFHTPFSSTIGNSFLAMAGAYTIVALVFATNNTFSYMDLMLH